MKGAWQSTHSRVWLGSEDVPLSAKVGDQVEGSARFARIHGPSNPAEADSRPRFARSGVSAVGALERGSLAVLHFSSDWSRRAEEFRARFTKFVQQEIGEGDRSALVAALKARKWAQFAKGYNGPEYARNLYDAKLAQADLRYQQAETEDASGDVALA